MIRRSLARLRRMGAAEVAWRGTTAARTLFDRARTRLVPPQWSRTDLLGALASIEGLTPARAALKARRWDEAQRELAQHFAHAPRRFAISPQSKSALIGRIRQEFPDAVRHATQRGDRLVEGNFDLLGYQGLRFDRTDVSDLRDLPAPPAPPGRTALSGRSGLPDWQLDPVMDRRPPQAFWSTVPYLDPTCGDHKIIWELNRHQHWLALGRAFWLTGDRRYRDRCLSELAGWLDANPPLVGVNWASMLEIAFRSISWLWAIQLFVEAPALREPPGHPEPRRAEDAAVRNRPDDEAPWLVDLLVGLDRQLTQIERNLSHYFSPNTHLLGEALALYVTGRALPELAASARRASIGRAVLIQEIARQVGADGGHCERSTHYHRYTLDFYALALIVARQTDDDEAARFFEDAVARLGAAARLLADDSGRVPHIGDDDGGALMPLLGRDPDDLRASLAVAAALVGRPDLQIGAPPEDALWLLGPSAVLPSAIGHQPSAVSSGSLPETGYYVSRACGAHLMIDGGPHGYQNGGHAHADALSLTFAVRGTPLLIDPGTACYTIDPAMRDRMRSTALHNTLTLDDRSQSLPNGPFHWSHVANGAVHRWRTHQGFDYFDGSHDGYRPVHHRRRVLVMHGDLVVVADFVDGPGAHAAAVHWHLDPRWTVTARARGAVFTRAADDGGDRVGLSVPQGVVDGFSGDVQTGLGWYSPAYGRVDRTTTVRIAQKATAPFWMMSVFDLDPENPVSDVDWVPVWSEAGALAHAAAIRVTRSASVDHVMFGEPLAETAEPASLRIGEVETDARMLFYRSTLDQPFTRVAIVDGSFARAAGRRGFDVTLPEIVPAFFFDGTNGERRTTNGEPRTTNLEPRTTNVERQTTKDQQPCAASPVS
jgi:Heparinase II/III-like protein/Heparinase II/III N-terminus